MSQVKESHRTLNNIKQQLDALAKQIDAEDDESNYAVTVHQNGRMTIRKRPENTDYPVSLSTVYAVAIGEIVPKRKPR